MPPLENQQQATDTGAGGGSGGFDTEGALSEISQGLGFNADTNEDIDTQTGGEGDDTTEGGQTAAPAQTPAPTAAPAGTPTGTTPPVNTTVAPNTWKKEPAALFATLPPAIQQEIHRRESDMWNGLTQYKQAANFGQNLHRAMKDFLPILAQHNIDPAQQVNALFSTHHTLVTGTPEEKLNIAVNICRNYGIDVPRLVAALDPANASYVDPQVQDLTRTVQTLQSTIAQQQQREAQKTRETLRGQLDAFANDPANVYFDEVANDMALLIKGGVCKTLKEAYDKAVYANPQTREKELARLTAERTAAERKAAAEKAEKARRASGANVRASQKSGSATAPLGTMEDTMRETLKNIRSRDS